MKPLETPSYLQKAEPPENLSTTLLPFHISSLAIAVIRYVCYVSQESGKGYRPS